VSDGARDRLAAVWWAGLAAVEPEAALGRALARDGDRLRLAGVSVDPARCCALAIGKAALGMARGLAAAARPRLGLAVAREAGAAPAGFRVELGSHPLPDARSAAAGDAALALARAVRPDETLVVLLSGGASALLARPLGEIDPAELRTVTELLLRSGAEISELNCVRKHLTAVSGGRLAAATAASRVAVLAISDVLGDDLATIASGPCAGDPTTFADARAILERRGIWHATPPSVREQLRRGISGEVEESLKPGDARLARVAHAVIASNRDAVEAAVQRGRELGFAVDRRAEPLRGEARELGRELAVRALAAARGRAQLTVAGGEPTVTVRGKGTGGRCQELALAAALALEGSADVALLAASTDGSDGPTEAAGAFADGGSVARGRAAGRSAEDDLAANDAHGFFAAEGGLFVPGATGTNALDLVLVAIPS
jgi:hydroxypyruvate reductase